MEEQEKLNASIFHYTFGTGGTNENNLFRREVIKTLIREPDTYKKERTRLEREVEGLQGMRAYRPLMLEEQSLLYRNERMLIALEELEIEVLSKLEYFK